MDTIAAAVPNRSNDQTRTCEDVEGVDRETEIFFANLFFVSETDC